MKKQLRETAKLAYLDSPDHCPYCKSDRILVGSPNFEDYIITLSVSCKECGRSWDDVYRLVNINENY